MIFEGFNPLFKKVLQPKDKIFIAKFDANDADGEYADLASDLDKLESRMQNLVG